MAEGWPTISGLDPEWRPVTMLRRWLYPYVFLALGTFLAGAIAGSAAMTATSPEALAATAEAFQTPGLYPDRLTVGTIFWNNVVALAVIAGGALTFGLLSFVGLFFNGLLIGTVAYVSLTNGEFPQFLALVVPHGVLEVAAFFVVGGVAYRSTWLLVSYLRGDSPQPITRQGAIEAAGLCAGAVIAIAVAAWIEAELTVDIARLLVDLEPGQ